jgi:hypothetical protein
MISESIFANHTPYFLDSLLTRIGSDCGPRIDRRLQPGTSAQPRESNYAGILSSLSATETKQDEESHSGREHGNPENGKARRCSLVIVDPALARREKAVRLTMLLWEKKKLRSDSEKRRALVSLVASRRPETHVTPEMRFGFEEIQKASIASLYKRLLLKDRRALNARITALYNEISTGLASKIPRKVRDERLDSRPR